MCPKPLLEYPTLKLPQRRIGLNRPRSTLPKCRSSTLASAAAPRRGRRYGTRVMAIAGGASAPYFTSLRPGAARNQLKARAECPQAHKTAAARSARATQGLSPSLLHYGAPARPQTCPDTVGSVDSMSMMFAVTSWALTPSPRDGGQGNQFLLATACAVSADSSWSAAPSCTTRSDLTTRAPHGAASRRRRARFESPRDRFMDETSAAGFQHTLLMRARFHG